MTTVFCIVVILLGIVLPALFVVANNTSVERVLHAGEQRRALALLESDQSTTRAAELAVWSRGPEHRFSCQPPFRFDGSPMIDTPEDDEDLKIDGRLRSWNRKRPGPIPLHGRRD